MIKFKVHIHYSGRKWYAYMPFGKTTVGYESMKFKRIL